ncbi:hypothetical protein [Actinomadura rubrisoli]|uniref:Uncharacterized protein n=1 Tax=Actinomadura rubrisoli TaxID=2530368 RepID=A0A4R5A8S5_9ACTN|nr:hypothetical protein [Actinomadura rubrisoli]TDD68583.1 hypothetical protein E1298_38275 [Actinomadura rubrisoli]
MTLTIAPRPTPSVLERLTFQRDEYRTEADRIAADLAIAPTVADLTRVEEELLAQLADVRRRRDNRSARDSEHRAAAEAADALDELIRRLNPTSAPAAGPLVDRPRPDPDPLAGPAGIITDSREEVASTTGGFPTIPAQSAAPVSVPSGQPGPAEQVREGLDVPGALVATSGPTKTMPDPSAQPTPLTGPRHKKGRM